MFKYILIGMLVLIIKIYKTRKIQHKITLKNYFNKKNSIKLYFHFLITINIQILVTHYFYYLVVCAYYLSCFLLLAARSAPDYRKSKIYYNL